MVATVGREVGVSMSDAAVNVVQPIYGEIKTTAHVINLYLSWTETVTCT